MKTINDLKYEYYATALGYNVEDIMASKTINDLEYEFFSNPPAAGVSQTDFDALESRVSANDAELAAHEARITALETP